MSGRMALPRAVWVVATALLATIAVCGGWVLWTDAAGRVGRVLVIALAVIGMLVVLAVARRRDRLRAAAAARSERTAAQRTELLEHNAAHLAEATTVAEVATVTAADLCRAGIANAAVFELRGERLELLARCAAYEGAGALPLARLEEAATAAMRSGGLVREAGVAAESTVSVPLRNGTGAVTGAIVAVVPDGQEALHDVRLFVTSVVEQCGIALDRARLESREREARRRALALQTLSSRLSAALGPTEVGQATARSLVETFGPYRVAVGIDSGEGLDIVTLAYDEVDPSFVRSLPPAVTSVVANVAASKAPLEAHGARQLADACGTEASAELKAEGVRSLHVLPLRQGTGFVGLMFTRIRVLNGSERETFEAMRDGVSQALERATLFDRERDARRRAELLEANAAHLAAATTPTEVGSSTVSQVEGYGADTVAVWRLTGDGTLVSLATSDAPDEDWASVAPHELVDEALRTNALASVASAHEHRERFPQSARCWTRAGIECLSAVPLRSASGATVGAMLVGSKQSGWLTAERRRLVLGVAGQTGVALERALLFETEREARLLAELLERHAAHLAGAVTTADVAAATVAELERAGFALASLYERRPDCIELLASVGLRAAAFESAQELSLDSDTFVADAIRAAEPIELETAAELDARYPASSERRAAAAVETALAVPLHGTARHVIGALVIGSTSPRWLTPARRSVILGIAEQCGVALERAQLQAERDRAARAASFLAELGDALEHSTTAVERARRLTALLTPDRARFAAVHLLDGSDPVLAASDGEPTPALLDEPAWERRVRRAVAVGARRGDAGAPSAPGGEGVVLPLLARGRALGALTFVPARGTPGGPVVDLAGIREIAARAAILLDNALLFERERDASHALQVGLLAGALAPVDGVDVSATYRTGTELLEVGGDWYDAFPLPNGAVALVVGDVVGHGLDAAVTMARLRGAVAALAQTSSPGVLLERLDEFIENVPAATAATLAYVALGMDGTIRYACAGHPPPLVVSADGATRFLWDGRSPPLGSIFAHARVESEDRLDEGDTLVLYTDGLVERRSESLEAGFDRLAATATLLADGGATLADELSDALLEGQQQDDDVCVLVVHRASSSPSFRRAFVADPGELRPMRLALTGWLEEQGVERERALGTILAASEAAANAIEHGYAKDGIGVVVVSAQIDARVLRVTVRDEGGWREQPAPGDRGRGFRLIQSLMDDISVDRSAGGTVVRMTQSVRTRAPA